MGILNKLKNEITGRTTRGFYFGHTEAEGEIKAGKQNLDHYFEDYLEVLPKILNERFIFIGRKGVGKSAIAKFLKDSSDKELNSYADIIKFNDIELESIVQHVPENEKNNIELLIFEWLILVRLIKLIVKSDLGKYTPEHKKIKDFLDRNTGFAEIDKYHLNEIIEKKKLEVSISVLQHAFGSILGKYYDAKRIKAPFYHFVTPLKEIVQQVLKFQVFEKSEFLILFDDLDIKFKADSEDSKEKLLALIRAAKNINNDIFRNTHTRVLIFLRDDIKNVLETRDSDTSKIFSSYDIPLNWYNHEIFRHDENLVELKRFANKRIGLNFESINIDFNISDPWNTLFKEDLKEYNGKSSFKYFIDFTFYRPRDIVLFLSEIGNNDYNYPLDSKNFKFLIKKFIEANIKELKSEFSIHYSEIDIKNLFTALKQICNSGTNICKDTVIEIFKDKLPLHDSQKVLELMLEYSILILKDTDTDRLYFNYRNNNIETADFESKNITTHKLIYKYFNP